MRTAMLVAVMLAVQTAFAAINLGSIASSTSATVPPGGTARFRIVLFTLEESVDAHIRSEHDPDISVSISPADTTLTAQKTQSPSSCENCVWVVLADGRTYARAVPVDIYVKIPEKVSKNVYNVKVIADASPHNPYIVTKGISQRLVQSREFYFRVYVPSTPVLPTVEKPEVQPIIEKELNPTPTTVAPPKTQQNQPSMPTGFITLTKQQQTNLTKYAIIIAGLSAVALILRKTLM